MIWNLIHVLIELTYTFVFWTVNTLFVTKKFMFTKLLPQLSMVICLSTQGERGLATKVVQQTDQVTVLF
jgi:hypothetical protein